MSDQLQLNSLPLTKSGVATQTLMPYRDYSNDPYWLQLDGEIRALRIKQKEHQKYIDQVEANASEPYFTTPDGVYYKIEPPLTTYVPTTTISMPE